MLVVITVINVMYIPAITIIHYHQIYKLMLIHMNQFLFYHHNHGLYFTIGTLISLHAYFASLHQLLLILLWRYRSTNSISSISTSSWSLSIKNKTLYWLYRFKAINSSFSWWDSLSSLSKFKSTSSLCNTHSKTVSIMLP